MTVDPLGLMSEVDRATERLLRNVADLPELEAPSRLPGWSRGALLARIIDNAEAYAAVLTAVAQGREPPRVTDLPATPARPATALPTGPHTDQHADLLARLRASAAHFAEAVATMPLTAWRVDVVCRRALRRPAAALLWERLRVVELHHVDLDVGYSPADWSDGFSHRLLHDLVTECGKRDAPPLVLSPLGAGHPLMIGKLMIGTAADGVPTVRGPVRHLAGWLSGRGDGDGLTVVPEGPLPSPPISM